MAENASSSANLDSPPLPRVTIQFCTQCKWMLRAAYFAQELLSTFSTALGEVALQPTTGGVFRVELVVAAPAVPAAPGAAGFHARASPADGATRTHLLWDRKTDGGFPEAKELKRRVRDVVDPARDLGHVDRDYPPRRAAAGEEDAGAAVEEPAPHGVGAHTRKPPASATDEVRERLEARHRAAESGPAPGPKADGEACEDCA